MDEIKAITRNKILEISSVYGFNERLLLKDYYITLILYLLKDVEAIYFKGGTALQKIFLDYSRLSEDTDFTVTYDIEEVKRNVIKSLNNSGFFNKITKDKDVDNFTRLVAHYLEFDNKEETIFIDLNRRAKLSTKPEKDLINHFYNDFIPSFSVNTLSKKEMIAEKVAATIGRNMPRDHFDVYQVIKKGIPIDMVLVKEKCRQSGNEFSVIKMFNNANKLKNRWDEDLVPLLAKETSFQEVMTKLARHFKLKKEKEKIKNSKKATKLKALYF